MVRAFRQLLWLPAVPLFAAVVATALFLMQHGFGVGHRRFDQALGILALPGNLLVEHLPISDSVSDFALVILLPAVFNLALWIGLTLVLRFLLRCSPSI